MTTLIALIIQQLPGVIALVRSEFTAANPEAPVPTEAEIVAAYIHALASSLAKDEDWLRQHPE